MIEQYQAGERLQSEIELALKDRSAYDFNGELALDGFRLRSNAANIWLGSMAGADKLAAKVSVLQGARPVRSQSRSRSSRAGHPGKGRGYGISGTMIRAGSSSFVKLDSTSGNFSSWRWRRS